MAHTYIGGNSLAEKALAFYCTHTPNHRGKGLVERVFRQRFTYNVPRILTRDGLKWSLDPNEFNQFWFLLNPRTNQHVLKILTRFLTPNATLVDVGANFGMYSVPLAHRSLPLGARVLSVEPNPVTYALLQSNFKLNTDLANAEAVNLAAGSKPGELTLHYSKQFLGSSSLYPSDGQSERALVRIQTLDAILSERGVGKVSAIKIDVEGHEQSVLLGATATLQDHRPPIVYELNQGSLRTSDHEANWYFEFFANAGYVQYEVNRDDTFAPIPTAERLGAIRFSDILALPKERVEEFRRGVKVV